MEIRTRYISEPRLRDGSYLHNMQLETVVGKHCFISTSREGRMEFDLVKGPGKIHDLAGDEKEGSEGDYRTMGET